MKQLTWAIAALSGMLFAGQALALTITNNDAANQKITIIEGDNAAELMLAPGQVGEQVCRSGCIIRMQNGDEYDFEGVEVVVIEGDALYLEDAPLPQGDGVLQDPDAPRAQ
jgi:hypothetical protein